MLGPLMVLAVLSLGGGFSQRSAILEPMFPLHEGHENAADRYLASAAGFLGIAIAYCFTCCSPALPESHRQQLSSGFISWSTTSISSTKIYDATWSSPLFRARAPCSGAASTRADRRCRLTASATRARGIGGVLRLLQSGNIRSYAAWVVIGSVLVIIAHRACRGGGR